MSQCTVVNKYKDEYDVYCGRGSMWGNPFPIGMYTREEAIDAFRKHFKESILNGTITLDDLRSLKGKRLGCFCKPKACHCDVIAEIVNRL